jgi:hypothetical protein
VGCLDFVSKRGLVSLLLLDCLIACLLADLVYGLWGGLEIGIWQTYRMELVGLVRLGLSGCRRGRLAEELSKMERTCGV